MEIVFVVLILYQQYSTTAVSWRWS